MSDKWKSEARRTLEEKIGVSLEKVPGDKEWVYETMRAQARCLELEAKITELNAHIVADDMARLDWSHSKNVIAALKAENGRLKAPVSHEEWCMHSIQCEAEHVGKFVMERVDFDDVIAARAQQPNPAQDKEQGWSV